MPEGRQFSFGNKTEKAPWDLRTRSIRSNPVLAKILIQGQRKKDYLEWNENRLLQHHYRHQKRCCQFYCSGAPSRQSLAQCPFCANLAIKDIWVLWPQRSIQCSKSQCQSLTSTKPGCAWAPEFSTCDLSFEWVPAGNHYKKNVSNSWSLQPQRQRKRR